MSSNKVRHEVWEDEEGLTGLVRADESGDKFRAMMRPGSKLIHVFEAGSHYEAMTIYYKIMDWGKYETEFEIDKIPYDQKIGGAQIVAFLKLTNRHSKTGNTQHFVHGKAIDQLYGLAICKYENESGFYLFYCNENWTELADTFHETIDQAKEQAEVEFEGTISYAAAFGGGDWKEV